MSTDPRETEAELAEEIGPDRRDGSTELDWRAAFAVLFNDPDVRGYLLAALGALGMILLMLFRQNSDVGGLLIVLIGVFGILFRWTWAPMVVLLILMYFMVFPFGYDPEFLRPKPQEIEGGRFRPSDLILVMSVLVYVVSHYRIMGLVHLAIPFESATRTKDETPTRRPPALISPSEVGVMLAISAVLVVAGQGIWWFANRIEAAPEETIPLKWARPGWSILKDDRFGRVPVRGPNSPTRVALEVEEEALPVWLSPGTVRFLVLVGLLFFVTVLGRLVFGYWRLRTMGPAEGAMILLDGGWAETKRERSRLEKWRIWGRKRTKTGSKP